MVIYKKGEAEIMLTNLETLKTSGVGVSGWWLTGSGWLPDFVSVCVGISTVVYLVIRIYKELKK